MRTFWTEKEIETYLTRETRTVHLSGGRERTLSCFNLTWRNLDGLVYYKIFTEEQLCDTAEKIAKETGKSFEECFSWVIGYSFSEMKLIHYDGGIPATTMPPIPRK